MQTTEIVSSHPGDESPASVPEQTHSFFREDTRVLGHLVIDSSIGGISVGGVRMIREMPISDLCHLARTMTLKCSFLKWPFGGAKAAILTHCDNPSPQQRRDDIRSFAERLVPLRGRYLPGADVGTNEDDLDLIRQVLRLGRPRRAPDSGFYAALTVRMCAARLMREQGLRPAQCTAAVEGFGKVGGWAVRLLSELGCRVVAVSTSKGAVYHPDGLDVDGLLRARVAFADECTTRYDRACRIEVPQLLTLPVDLLVPCASLWSIRQTNAGQVQAKMVVCGANNAVTDKGKETLAARGVTCFPDFVSNSGGVLGSIIEMLRIDTPRAAAMLREQFEPKLEHLVAEARSTGRSLEAVARDIAAANHREMRQRQIGASSRLAALAGWACRCGLLPQTIADVLARAYIRRTMV